MGTGTSASGSSLPHRPGPGAVRRGRHTGGAAPGSAGPLAACALPRPQPPPAPRRGATPGPRRPRPRTPRRPVFSPRTPSGHAIPDHPGYLAQKRSGHREDQQGRAPSAGCGEPGAAPAGARARPPPAAAGAGGAPQQVVARPPLRRGLKPETWTPARPGHDPRAASGPSLGARSQLPARARRLRSAPLGSAGADAALLRSAPLAGRRRAPPPRRAAAATAPAARPAQTSWGRRPQPRGPETGSGVQAWRDPCRDPCRPASAPAAPPRPARAAALSWLGPGCPGDPGPDGESVWTRRESRAPTLGVTCAPSGEGLGRDASRSLPGHLGLGHAGPGALRICLAKWAARGPLAGREWASWEGLCTRIKVKVFVVFYNLVGPESLKAN